LAFTIPNTADAAFSDQSQVDKVDVDIWVAGSHGYGVTSGCAVTSTGAANGSVSVAAGQVRQGDPLVSVSSTTVAIAANSSGNPRYDLITVPASGVPMATQGTAAASPVFPAVPAGSVALAAVRVPNGHTATTTTPANTIVDKRMLVSPKLGSDSVAQNNIVMTDPAKMGMVIQGVEDPSAFLKNLLEVKDYLGAPIFAVLPAGGLFVNDNIATYYTYAGPKHFFVDIYGFMKRNTQASYAFAGPPGNMLSFANSCHELFQSSRASTVADWSVVSGGTLSVVDMGAPPNTPTTYRSSLRLTNNSGSSVWIAQPGSFLAVPGITAGVLVSGVAMVKSNSAAAARNVTVRLSFYNDAGTQIGADVNSTAVSVPNTGVWTRVSLAAVATPSGATRVQIHVLVASLNGESHDVCGVGIMKGPEAVFAPPFVVQNPSGSNELGAVAGDRWVRTDVPHIPGRREYVQTLGTLASPAAPRDQNWEAIDTSTVYRLNADVASTVTTQAAIADFAVPVDANSPYTVDYTILLTSAALTTGWQFGITGPASPTRINATCEFQSSATAWTTSTINSFTNFTLVAAAYTTTNPIAVRIRLQLMNGVNAGTVNLTFATEVSGSAITIRQPSMAVVT
jgi:hypothetical protein